VGASTTVTTTVYNGTDVENDLLSSGRFTATLPGQLGGASQNSSFTLLPTARKSLVLNGTAADANGVFPSPPVWLRICTRWASCSLGPSTTSS
jgi:hypothetical protein